MTKQGQQIVRLKQAVKERYAWPGGYPIVLYPIDGGMMCADCGKKNLGLIVRDIVKQDCPGWACVPEIYWEGPEIECCNCGELIESAYGMA